MKHLLLLIFALASLVGFTQDKPKVFYSDGKRVMSAETFDDFKRHMRLKLGKDGLQVNFNIYKKLTRNDSLIRYFKYTTKKADPGFHYFEYLKVGKPLPDLPLQQLSGDTMHLSDLEGKPIVLNFWHTRCYPCIKEMPQLNKIKDDYTDRVHFLAVTDDGPEKVNTFLKDHEFSFTHIVRADEFSDTCGILAVPKFFYIDKNGNFLESGRGIGFIKGEDGKLRMGSDAHIRGAIDDLLKE